MTKADLIAEVSRVVEVTRREAEAIEVPPKTIPFFKPAREVQGLINPEEPDAR